MPIRLTEAEWREIIAALAYRGQHALVEKIRAEMLVIKLEERGVL